jgi:RNA polymerase sigma-70 factor (ECF subfamily)
MKAVGEALLFPGVVPVRTLPPTARPRAANTVSPPVPTDEAALCAAALRGDEAAWNALVQKHNQRVMITLLARGVRVDRAKDIAQEAWMRLVEQQRMGRLERLVLPGLAIAQASFLALEAARRDATARRHDPIDEVVTAALADPRADAEASLMTEERVARAVEVLSGCSASAREVFRLAYGGEGLSHAEVARRVGLSLQRVRQILCEVRARLRAAVQDGTSAAPPRRGRNLKEEE